MLAGVMTWLEGSSIVTNLSDVGWVQSYNSFGKIGNRPEGDQAERSIPRIQDKDQFQ